MPRYPALSLVVAAVLGLPAAAQAATLAAAKDCYRNDERPNLVGEGFAPDSPIDFTVNGRRLDAAVNADENGEVAVRYTPVRTATEDRLVIRATDAEGTSAAVTIFVTAVREFSAQPRRTDNVLTWRAVFKLYGFGARKRAFVHYVDPGGKLRRTIRLGRLRGPCGRLKTERRRVMPFASPRTGTWRLQFDTRRRYSKRTANKRVITVEVYRG